jgi:hypothetical protein
MNAHVFVPLVALFHLLRSVSEGWSIWLTWCAMAAKAGAFAYVRVHSRLTFFGRATPDRLGARTCHADDHSNAEREKTLAIPYHPIY